jgi:hypothetical protein
VEQHGRPDADAIALDRGNDWDFASRERAKQLPHWNVVVAARHRAQKIREVVASREILPVTAYGD